MAKLWQKINSVDELMERFTVGQDYLIDRKLTAADCAGSIAHARMLHKQGYLSTENLRSLEGVLKKIYRRFHEGSIEISIAQEDCHTFIEEILTEELGDAGKRIHLGRSRNDQSLTALRLYGREYVLAIQAALCALIGALIAFAEKHAAVPMPGRTHLQLAMPSSVGLWASAFAEELIDGAQFLEAACGLFNRSPLGTAAGYGVPLKIDRDYSAGIMGFPSVQNNVIAVQNSRGRLEAMICDALDQSGLVLSKMAQDLILFSLPEFAYFTLPPELCTGSSIMPQKKNPDGLELLRSRLAGISSRSAEIKLIIRALPSGYNRDFQDIKEPFLACLENTLQSIQVAELVFNKLVLHEDALRAAHRSEIFATDEALRLVEEGMPFREAYHHVAAHLDKLKTYNIDETLQSRAVRGYPAQLGLEQAKSDLSRLSKIQKKQEEQHFTALKNLLGEGARLLGEGARLLGDGARTSAL